MAKFNARHAQVQVFNGKATYPMAEAIASKIPIREFVERDPVVADLYGYTALTFNAARAESVFRVTYAKIGELADRNRVPLDVEVNVALEIMEQRADGANR